MRNRIDIHNFDRRLDIAEKLVAKSNPISKKNTSLIQEFETHCFTDGLGKKRITKYVYSLRKLAEWLEKDFDQVSRKDIENRARIASVS